MLPILLSFVFNLYSRLGKISSSSAPTPILIFDTRWVIIVPPVLSL